jgi:hypothetical protein
MWTSKIKSVKSAGDYFEAVLEFTDGVNVYGDTIKTNGGASMEWIKGNIKNRIKTFESNATLAQSVVLNQDVDLSEVVPTQDEIDKQEFLKDYRNWTAVKKAIDVGILTGSETPVVNLLNKVKSEFKVAYLTLL